MNDQRDALEQELEAMTPCELSPDVRRRIGQSLIRDVQSNRNVRWWWGGLVAAAACVAIAISGWRIRVSLDTGPHQTVPGSHYLAGAPTPNATLGSYKLAFARSPDRFDALLDQQAARPLAAGDSDSHTFRPFDLISIP
jgi:hypothetical protein